MTLPDERISALVNALSFLQDLCNPERAPRVPSYVRERARRILKHYPSPYYIAQLAEGDVTAFKEDDDR